MIEASLLLIELVFFGLVLVAVGRRPASLPNRNLGIFSYREKIEIESKTSSASVKGSRSA